MHFGAKQGFDPDCHFKLHNRDVKLILKGHVKLRKQCVTRRGGLLRIPPFPPLRDEHHNNIHLTELV